MHTLQVPCKCFTDRALLRELTAGTLRVSQSWSDCLKRQFDQIVSVSLEIINRFKLFVTIVSKRFTSSSSSDALLFSFLFFSWKCRKSSSHNAFCCVKLAVHEYRHADFPFAKLSHFLYCGGSSIRLWCIGKAVIRIHSEVVLYNNRQLDCC